MTREQAYEILGITSDELKNNEIIQKLLESHAAQSLSAQGSGTYMPMMQLNSLVESQDGHKQIKIRNFQALIDDNYNHNSNNNASLFYSKLNSFVSTTSKGFSSMNDEAASTTSEITNHLSPDDFSKQV